MEGKLHVPDDLKTKLERETCLCFSSILIFGFIQNIFFFWRQICTFGRWSMFPQLWDLQGHIEERFHFSEKLFICLVFSHKAIQEETFRNLKVDKYCFVLLALALVHSLLSAVSGEKVSVLCETGQKQFWLVVDSRKDSSKQTKQIRQIEETETAGVNPDVIYMIEGPVVML